MTRIHFAAMAEIIKAIAAGEWTDDLPVWVPRIDAAEETLAAGFPTARLRAIQTAEAFINLAERFNPLFDRSRFLQAAGLQAQTSKRRKAGRTS